MAKGTFEPTVYTRDQIGLAPPKSRSKITSVEGAIIHHSAGSRSDDAGRKTSWRGSRPIASIAPMTTRSPERRV